MTEPNNGSAAVIVPNVWVLQPDRNPYLHNVFVLLGIDPDEGERAYHRRCERADAMLRGGRTLEVFGRTVQDTDIARAHTLTRDEGAFLAERMLVHTTHKIDPKTLAEPLKAIEAIAIGPPADVLPLAVSNLSFVTEMLPPPEGVEASGVSKPPVEAIHELFRFSEEEERVFDV
jgi:hypothetical protein